MSNYRTSFTVHSGTRFSRTVRVEVNGDLDTSSAPGFRLLMADFVRDAEVVVDLAGCGFVDAAGIGSLVGAVRRVRAAGGSARVVGAIASVRFALRTANAESVLELNDARTAAAVAG